MNPKKYMEEAGRLHRRIHCKENEIRSIRADAEGITGMSNSDMLKTASPNPHKIEAAVCKIISLEDEVKSENTRWPVGAFEAPIAVLSLTRFPLFDLPKK